MVQKKLSEKRASRISAIKKLPAVNRDLATEMLSDEQDSDSDGNKKKSTKKHKLGTLMEDDRFTSMFSDQDYQIDPTSLEYKLHHPSESQTKHLSKKFERVEEDEGSDDDMVRFSKDNKKAGPKFYELKVNRFVFLILRMDLVLQKRLRKSWKRLLHKHSILVVDLNRKGKRRGMISGPEVQEICLLPLIRQRKNENLMGLRRVPGRESKRERFLPEVEVVAEDREEDLEVVLGDPQEVEGVLVEEEDKLINKSIFNLEHE
jgi:NUC153 domain